MSEADFTRRVAAMEFELTTAHRRVEAGQSIDLDDLTPRLEDLCAEAVLHQGPSTAIRLAVLVVRLDALEASLNQRLEGSSGGASTQSDATPNCDAT
jgi:hypothetical protein